MKTIMLSVIKVFLLVYINVVVGSQIEKSSNFPLSSNTYDDKAKCGTNTNSSCPQWSFCGSNGICQCPDIPYAALKCDIHGQITGILTCNCITYDEDRDRLEIGMCYYGCHGNKSTMYPYQRLPSNMSDWNEFVCGKYNRRGTLCGQCKEGYYTSVYSYDLKCVKCPDGTSNWWKFILIAFVPLTLFYIVIFVFRINVHSTYLQGYVLFCQASTIIPIARHLVFKLEESRPFIQNIVYSLGTILSVWNLDFFRFFNHGICFKMKPLVAVSLDLLVAVYPLSLIAISYALIYSYDHLFLKKWKPLKIIFRILNNSRKIRNSLVDAFSTFFFLLGMKCMNVCIDFLLPVKVYQVRGLEHNIISEYRLYFDASISYFSRDHLPYGISAVIVIMLVGIIPTLLFFLYPLCLFQKIILRILPESFIIYLHTFVDTIQCSCKNGTEKGTVDLRWFSGVIFGARIFFMIVFGLTLNTSFYIAIVTILSLFVVAFIIAEPFKDYFSHLSGQFVIFVLLIAVICVVCTISSMDI